MKKQLIILLAVFLASSTNSYAQEEQPEEKSTQMKTLFSSSSDNTLDAYGGYGGVFLRPTKLHGQFAMMIGGKGGVILNHSLALGLVGEGAVPIVKYAGVDKNNNSTNVSLGMGAGGIFIEYINNVKAPIHFSVPVNIMAGGAFVSNANTYRSIESTGLFIVEPGINLEFNLRKFFIIALGANYRIVSGSRMINASNSDLSGLSYGIDFKFGFF